MRTRRDRIHRQLRQRRSWLRRQRAHQREVERIAAGASGAALYRYLKDEAYARHNHAAWLDGECGATAAEIAAAEAEAEPWEAAAENMIACARGELHGADRAAFARAFAHGRAASASIGAIARGQIAAALHGAPNPHLVEGTYNRLFAAGAAADRHIDRALDLAATRRRMGCARPIRDRLILPRQRARRSHRRAATRAAPPGSSDGDGPSDPPGDGRLLSGGGL